jgi:hypothetical protein
VVLCECIRTNNFLTKCNIDIPAVQADDSFLNLACYNPIKNVFEINLRRVTVLLADSYGLSIEDYIVILMSHEIGHYLDPNRELLQKKINKLFMEIEQGNYTLDLEEEILKLNELLETNADQVGLGFISEDLANPYVKMNMRNLEVTGFNMLRTIDNYRHNSELFKLNEELASMKTENNILKDRIDVLEKMNTFYKDKLMNK